MTTLREIAQQIVAARFRRHKGARTGVVWYRGVVHQVQLVGAHPSLFDLGEVAQVVVGVALQAALIPRFGVGDTGFGVRESSYFCSFPRHRPGAAAGGIVSNQNAGVGDGAILFNGLVGQRHAPFVVVVEPQLPTIDDLSGEGIAVRYGASGDGAECDSRAVAELVVVVGDVRARALANAAEIEARIGDGDRAVSFVIRSSYGSPLRLRCFSLNGATKLGKVLVKARGIDIDSRHQSPVGVRVFIDAGG